MNAISTNSEQRDGLVAGLITYAIWGVLPVFFKLTQSVPSTEVLLHRIVWAVPFGALIIQSRQQWPEVRRALAHRDTLLWLSLSACLIAMNWLTYIWAVQHNQVFQASLGYYINPLIWVLVGVLFFKERLGPLQLVAVLLAAIGVAILSIAGGRFPFISLLLAISFTCYGVIRKRVAIGAMPGLFVETAVLWPVAIIWLSLLLMQGELIFGSRDPGLDLLMVMAGPITVVPLLLFAIATRRLALSTIGFMQFIAPTLQFLVGVLYGEALTLPHLLCFGFIWAAVLVFSLDALGQARKRSRRQETAGP